MRFSPSCREFNSLQKYIQHFYIGPILFQKNKILRLVVGGKVDGQILFGTRSEKPKFYLAPGMRNGKIYLAPNDSYEKFYLAVKGLTLFCQNLRNLKFCKSWTILTKNKCVATVSSKCIIIFTLPTKIKIMKLFSKINYDKLIKKITFLQHFNGVQRCYSIR